MTTHKPRMPAGMGTRGKALWKAVSASLPDGWAWDERETEVLAMACHQADDLAALEAAIKSDGATIAGSKGQPVLHPAFTEARQARLTISRLLGTLALPSGDDEPKRMTAASRHAQAAARARWSRSENVRRQREALAKGKESDG